nr:hypothetical protein CFP56_64182 [Quercus suber]
MTTRRAAKNRHSDGNTPSFTGSTEDDNSRRGSFDDFRPVTSPSNDSQFSAVHMMFSNEKTVNGLTDEQTNGVQNSIEAPRDSLLARPSSPELPAKHIPSVSIAYAEADSRKHDEAGRADANELGQPSGRQRSPDSSQSDNGGAVRDQLATAAPSTDITPTPSAAPSPASSMSGSDNDMSSNSVKPAVEGLAGGIAIQEEVEELDDVDIDEEDVHGTQGQATGNVRRRIGGRKRAPHPDPKVEAAMRRQAHLKTAYRHLGKALKPLLDEIAGRTLDDLQDEKLYMRAAEFRTVRLGLDCALARRRKLIQTQNDLDLELWDEVLRREQDVQRSKALQQFEESQDLALTALEREIAEIERAINVANDSTGQETEDEDGVVPRTKSASYRYKRGDALDAKYDSRSRIILHTRRVVEDVQLRSNLGRMLQDFGSEGRKDVYEAFTTMDCTARDFALAKREAMDRVAVLAKAAERVEQIAAIPVIANKDAVGLNVLGDLATRPSIRSAMPVKQLLQRTTMDHPPTQNFPLPMVTQGPQQSPPALLSPGFPREPSDLLDRTLSHSFVPRQVGPVPPGPQHFMFSPQFRAPEYRPFIDMNSSTVPPTLTPRFEQSATNLGNFRAYNPEPDWQEQTQRAERDQQDRPPASYRPWLQDPHLGVDRHDEDSNRRKSFSFPLHTSMELPRLHGMPTNGRYRDFGLSETTQGRSTPRIPEPQLHMNHHHPTYNTFGGEHVYMRAPLQRHQGSPQSHKKEPIDLVRSPSSRKSPTGQQTPNWRDRADSVESGDQSKSFDEPKADKAGQAKRKRSNRNRERGKPLLTEPRNAIETESIPGPRPHRMSLSDPPASKGAERFPMMQQQWQGQTEPQPAPRPAPSPAVTYALPAGYGPAPSTNYLRNVPPEHTQPYDRDHPPHHRPSLPGLLQSTRWSNNNLPTSPLFAVPQEPPAPVLGPPPLHQPPPPGVHPDSYRSQFPAAPPPRLRPGPPPPSLASGTGYGGPAIAPARYDQRFSFAGNFAPPPAFAQQEEHQRQQHRNSNEINRRRTHSDSQRPMKVIHHRPGKS